MMAVPTSTVKDEVYEKKVDALQREYSHDSDGKPASDEEGKLAVDYSGAHAKTDPAEIKLVKKLDKWIMVRVPTFCTKHVAIADHS